MEDEDKDLNWLFTSATFKVPELLWLKATNENINFMIYLHGVPKQKRERFYNMN